MVYDVAASKLTHQGVLGAKPAEREEGVRAHGSVSDSTLPQGLYVVATRTCPNCRRAEAMLDEAGIAYEVLFAEDNQGLVDRYGLMQAPSLLVSAGDGTVEVTAGAAAVFKEISGMKALA